MRCNPKVFNKKAHELKLVGYHLLYIPANIPPVSPRRGLRWAVAPDFAGKPSHFVEKLQTNSKNYPKKCNKLQKCPRFFFLLSHTIFSQTHASAPTFTQLCPDFLSTFTQLCPNLCHLLTPSSTWDLSKICPKFDVKKNTGFCYVKKWTGWTVSGIKYRNCAYSLLEWKVDASG